MAWLDAPGGGRLLITSDRHEHVVFTAAVDPSQARVEMPVAQTIIHNEKWLLNDAEAVTVKRSGGDQLAYVLCSQSNAPDGESAPNRRLFARIRVGASGQIDPTGVGVISAEPLRAALLSHLDALHVAPYVAFNVPQKLNTTRGINIEGIAWTPGQPRLLCGLRNPLAGDDAMVAVVEGVDEAFDRADPSLLTLVDLFRLDLGDRGVSDLAWDPVTRGYLIAAARSNGPKLTERQPYPLTDLDSAIFWWSGHKADDPVLVAKVRDLNVEAICRVGETDLIAIGSDEGDVSEGRVARQSVVMLVHFTGFAARLTGGAP